MTCPDCKRDECPARGMRVGVADWEALDCTRAQLATARVDLARMAESACHWINNAKAAQDAEARALERTVEAMDLLVDARDVLSPFAYAAKFSRTSSVRINLGMNDEHIKRAADAVEAIEKMIGGGT